VSNLIIAVVTAVNIAIAISTVIILIIALTVFVAILCRFRLILDIDSGNSRSEYIKVKMQAGFGSIFFTFYDSTEKDNQDANTSNSKKIAQKWRGRGSAAERNASGVLKGVSRLLLSNSESMQKLLTGVRIQSLNVRIENNIEDAAINAVVTGVLHILAANTALIIFNTFKFSGLGDAARRMSFFINSCFFSDGDNGNSIGNVSVNGNYHQLSDTEKDVIVFRANCILTARIAHIIHILILRKGMIKFEHASSN
jgi:hypothetical protein